MTLLFFLTPKFGGSGGGGVSSGGEVVRERRPSIKKIAKAIKAPVGKARELAKELKAQEEKAIQRQEELYQLQLQELRGLVSELELLGQESIQQRMVEAERHRQELAQFIFELQQEARRQQEIIVAKKRRLEIAIAAAMSMGLL